MADTMDKLLNGAGLVELWGILEDKYGIYKQHWWKATSNFGESFYRINIESKVTRSICIAANSYETIYYSKTASIDQTTGTITMDSPSSIDIDLEYEYTTDRYGEPIEGDSYSAAERADEQAEKLLALAPCYFTIGYNGTIYYLPEGATYGDDGNTIHRDEGSDYADESEEIYRYWPELYINPVAYNPVREVKPEYIVVEASKPTYFHSAERNAYPDSGEQDGIYYEYLGIPFEKTPTTPRIMSLSYVGTGTYGSANPNTVTFEFQPTFVFVEGAAQTSQTCVWPYGIPVCRTVSTSNATMLWDGKSLSWYSATAGAQRNELNHQYIVYYIG